MTPTEILGSLEALQKIIDVVASPVFVKDSEHRWVIMNDAMCKFMGHPKEELIGKSDFAFVPREQAEIFWAADDVVFSTGLDNENEEQLTDARGNVRTIVTRKRLIHVGDEVPLLVAAITDITEFRKAEAHSRYLAYHDPLSGLPNRALLSDKIDQELAHLAGSSHGTALLYIDLDRFKEVNDTYGHQAGDELIREFAGRLSRLVRVTDTVARLGGDEFAVLVPNVDSMKSVQALCERILEESRKPFDITGSRAFVDASIGVVVADDPVTTTRDDLLRKADVALYSAKKHRGCFRVFTEEMDESRRRRHIIERDLRQALDTGRGLDVFYQPLVSNADATIVSVEALVRWQHPQFGLLWPSQFLSIAEETGLIIPLGEWMLGQACRALRDWPPGISIALNVSPVQLRDPSFTERFLLIVRASGTDPDRIQLEITESAIMNADATIVAALRRLRRSGIKIALDDFGTGYSSLTKLRRLEIDKVKIDRSFVKHLGRSGDSAAIINAFAEIGRSLGLTVTAEGVETEAQRERLLASGCTELQGFLFSHPVPYDEISKLIGSRRKDRQVA